MSSNFTAAATNAITTTVDPVCVAYTLHRWCVMPNQENVAIKFHSRFFMYILRARALNSKDLQSHLRVCRATNVQ